MADTSQQELSEPHTNGAVDGLTEEEKSKMRPADIDADMREMERRKRVEMMVNSRLFREELERIIETQMKDGAGPSGLLQQISDMMGAQGARFNGNVFKNSNCVVPINDIRGVESMGYAKGEKLLRCKLAAVFRLLDLYGWTQGVGGMITARLNQDQEHFLVNPYGLLYHEVTASSLVKVDMQGAVVEQGTTNFGVHITGFQLHSTIHAARPDIKCVVHITTPSVTAISSLKCGLLPIGQESIVIGEVSTHQYVGGSFEPEEREKITRNLGPMNKVMLLTNRGALCCGETVEEAFFNVYNTVLACETQLKLMPAGIDNISLISEESKKAIFEASRKPPIPQHSSVAEPSPLAEKLEKRWRIGGTEFEALMRMLDNAGFRTGYIYRHPLVKGEPPRPKNDVEVPPAVSSLGYLLEEEELYKQGLWKGGRKGTDRSRWLNSPNVYQKVEILETGTPDPKKITKWVDQNAEEWVSDGSPTHSSTPVKIDSALQFVPKNTNPKEFKQIQQQIKDYRRADKISAGPQSHILEGVTWEEAKKMQDATISGTGEQVVLVGAASKGIIQRGFQHNAMVYKTPYAKNPFDAVTDQELDQYKKEVERKQKGDIYDESQSESEALSSFNVSRATHESSTAKSPIQSPVSVTSETEEESRDEPRVLRIETKQVPAPSQPEVVLSDESTRATSVIENPLEHKHTINAQSQQKFTVDATTEFLNEMRRSAIEPQNNVSRRDCGLSSSFSSESEDLARYELRDFEISYEPLIKLARCKTLAERMKPRFVDLQKNHEPQGLPRNQAPFINQVRKNRLAIKSSVERRRDFFENYEKRMLNRNNEAREQTRVLNGFCKVWNDVNLLNKKNAAFQPTSVCVAENQNLFLNNEKTLNIDSVKFNAALNTYPIPESVYFSILRNKNVNVNLERDSKNLEPREMGSLIYSVGMYPQVNYVETVSLSLDDNRDHRAKTIQDAEEKESDGNGNDVQKSHGLGDDNRSVDSSRSDINGNVFNNINAPLPNSCIEIHEEINRNTDGRENVDENGNSYKENDSQVVKKLSGTKSLFDLVNYIKDNLHSTVNNIEESFLEKPRAGRAGKNEIARSKSDGNLQEDGDLPLAEIDGKRKRGTECLLDERKVEENKKDVKGEALENEVDDEKDLIISGSCSMSFKKMNGITEDSCRFSKSTERSNNILQSYTSDSCLASRENDPKNPNHKKILAKDSAEKSSQCLQHMYCSDSCLTKKMKEFCRQDSITDVVNSINVNIPASKTTVDVLPETEISSKYNLDSTNMSLIYSLTLSADQCSSKNTSVDLENGSLEQSLEWQSDYAEESVSSEGSLERDNSDYIWLDLLMTSTKRESTPTPDVDLNETRELFDSSVDLSSQIDDEKAEDKRTCDSDNYSNQGSDILELPAKTILELKEIGGETFRSDISSVVDEIIDEINVAEVCLKAANVVDDICERVAAMAMENDAEKDLADFQGTRDNDDVLPQDSNMERNVENSEDVPEKDVTRSVIVIDEIVHHIVDNVDIRKSDSESSGEAHVRKRTKETTNAELKEMGNNPPLPSKSDEASEKLNRCEEQENSEILEEKLKERNLEDAQVKINEEHLEINGDDNENIIECNDLAFNVDSELTKVNNPLMASVKMEVNDEEVPNFVSSNEEVTPNDLPVDVEENGCYSSFVSVDCDENNEEKNGMLLDCPCLECKRQDSPEKTEDDNEALHELSCSCEECKERMQLSSSDDSFYYFSNSSEDCQQTSFTCDSCKVTKTLFLYLEEICHLSGKVYECYDCKQKRKARKKKGKRESEENKEESGEFLQEENRRASATLQTDETLKEKEEDIVVQTCEIAKNKNIHNTDAVLEFFTVAEVLPSSNDLKLNFSVESAKDEAKENNVFMETDNLHLRANKESTVVAENIHQAQVDVNNVEKTMAYYTGMSRYASTMKLDKLEEEPIERDVQEESVILSENLSTLSTALQAIEMNEQSNYCVTEKVKQSFLPAIYEESDESMEISDESGQCLSEKLRETGANETKHVLRERYPSYIDLSLDFDRPVRTPESPKSVDYFSCSSGQLKSQRNSEGNSKQSESLEEAEDLPNSLEDSDHLNSTYTISETSSGNEKQFDESHLAEYNADLSTNMDETRSTRQRNSDSSMSEVNLKVNGIDDSTANFADLSTNVFLSDPENGSSVKKSTKSNKRHNKKSKRTNVKREDEMIKMDEKSLPEVEKSCSKYTADPMTFSYDTQEFIRLEKAVVENSDLLTVASESN